MPAITAATLLAAQWLSDSSVVVARRTIRAAAARGLGEVVRTIFIERLLFGAWDPASPEPLGATT
jgi:hypothetical protein